MKPIKYIKIFLILIIFSFASYAQNQIKTGVIAGGGGMMNNNSHRIIGTIAQPTIGFSSNGINGITSGFWYEMFLTTDVERKQDLLPMDFKLAQNYPNPFNPSTTIKYSIKEESVVSIKIYNSIGQEVASFINEPKPAGNYSLIFNANNLASGIYFYRIQAGSFNQVKKMILLR